MLRKGLNASAQGKGISRGQGPSTIATSTIAAEELYTQLLYVIDVQLIPYSLREIPIERHSIVYVSAKSTVETLTMCIAAAN